MSIKDWPVNERPREKLLMRGATALSDAELLAIFLRTGTKGKSAVDLARTLLLKFGSLRALLNANQTQFCQGEGLGVAKFVQLRAVLEMAQRHFGEILAEQDVLENPTMTRNFLCAQMRDYPYEVFACLFLDSRHQVICFEKLFRGTLNNTSVHPREVVKRGLEVNAGAVIFAHNHPSGIAEPSEADKLITQQLTKALALVDIRVLDHFIIGDNAQSCFSFAEQGLMGT